MLSASIRQLLASSGAAAGLANGRLACARNLHLSAALPAEPLKKKKRINPQVEIERIKRKTRRIEKEIKRLESRGRYLKPLDEIEGERQFLKTLDSRQRSAPDLTEAELERRALLQKDWTRYKWQQLEYESSLLARQRREIYRAMEHLKTLDRELFEAASKPDESLIGLSITGPVYTLPQPADSFEAVDGDYRDVTPTYRYSFETDRKLTFFVKKK